MIWLFSLKEATQNLFFLVFVEDQKKTNTFLLMQPLRIVVAFQMIYVQLNIDFVLES